VARVMASRTAWYRSSSTVARARWDRGDQRCLSPYGTCRSKVLLQTFLKK
jgi:hypothetical protein